MVRTSATYMGAAPHITIAGTAELMADDPRRLALETRLAHLHGAKMLTVGLVTNLRIAAKQYGGSFADMTPTKICNAIGWDTSLVAAGDMVKILMACGFITPDGRAVFDDWKALLEKAASEQSFGCYLRNLRAKKMADDDISTQRYVADMIGVSASFLGELETDKKSPSPKTISALAAYFEVSYEEMEKHARIGRNEFRLRPTPSTFQRVPRAVLNGVGSQLERAWPTISSETVASISAALDRQAVIEDLAASGAQAHSEMMQNILYPPSPKAALKKAREDVKEKTLAELAAEQKPASKAKSGPNKGKK